MSSKEIYRPIEEFFSKELDKKEHYVYIYLNPLKPGKYTYGDFISFPYEPFYIGLGKNGRMYEHLKETKENTGNKYKFNTIQKILKSGLYPTIEKLRYNLSKEKAKELEILLIKIIGREDLMLGPLTNLTDGGEGASFPGEKNPMFGKKHSEETKKKIGEKRKGVPLSEEHKRKIGEGGKGRIVSEETKEKMRKTNIKTWSNPDLKEKHRIINLGINNPMFGKSPSKETRNKISTSLKGRIPWNKAIKKEKD